MEYVILVDDNDQVIGQMEKLEAHRLGKLHRAISVFILNSRNELLIQRRADSKYHSGSLWANTCCSHPRPEEEVVDAGKRRLKEEMGLTAELDHLYHFIYKAEFENGLTEHEYDHILIGYSDVIPEPNPIEVMEWKYTQLDVLEQALINDPKQYAVWFQKILPEFRIRLKEYQSK